MENRVRKPFTGETDFKERARKRADYAQRCRDWRDGEWERLYGAKRLFNAEQAALNQESEARQV